MTIQWMGPHLKAAAVEAVRTAVEPIARAAGATAAGAATTLVPRPKTVARSYLSVGDNERVGWLTANGRTLLSAQGLILQRSVDEGATWEALRTFAAAVCAVRELPNGELLVALYNSESGSTPGEVWRSTNYPTAGSSCTWTKTLTMTNKSAMYGWYSLSTPLHHHDDLPGGVNMGIMIGGSYGSKTLPDNARKVYATEDYGLTWRVIFDPPEADGYHHHGCEYDPWFDRVWISNGDGANRKLQFSDDWRSTTPTWTEVPTPGWQAVGIIAMPDCILMGSDDPPDGIWRLLRDDTTPNRVGAIESVYHLGSAVGDTAHYCRQIYKAPGGPVLFPFTATNMVGGDYRGHLIATMDGKSFHELWKDDQQYTIWATQTMGLNTIVGPMVSGKFLGDLVDERNPHTRVTMTAPGWEPGGTLLPGDADRRYLTPAGAAVTYQPLTSELWIPAADFGAVSGGSPVYGLNGTTSSGWLLDAAANERVTTLLRIPSGWATAIVQIYWSSIDANAGNVVMLASVASLLTGQTFNGAGLTTVETAAKAVPGANRYTTSATTALAVAVSDPSNSAAPRAVLRLDVGRSGTNAADTYASDVCFVGALVQRAS